MVKFVQQRGKANSYACRIFFDELSFAATLPPEEKRGGEREKIQVGEEGTIAGNKLCKITKKARFEVGGHFILSGDSSSIITNSPRPSTVVFETPCRTKEEEKKKKKKRRKQPAPGYEMRAGFSSVAQPVSPCHSLVRFPQRKQPRLVPATGTRLDSALPPFETSERTPLCVLSVNGYAKQSNYVDLCSDTSLLFAPFFSFLFFLFFSIFFRNAFGVFEGHSPPQK